MYRLGGIWCWGMALEKWTTRGLPSCPEGVEAVPVRKLVPQLGVEASTLAFSSSQPGSMLRVSAPTRPSQPLTAGR